MDEIIIHGGGVLRGEVAVSGAKNAALPVLFASLLTAQPCHIDNVPQVVDCQTTELLLSRLGVGVESDAGQVRLEAARISSFEAPYDLVKTMRASFLALGPLLARFGEARVATPGGCAIGSRPVDLHLEGFEKMGATIHHTHGYVEARAPRPVGGGPRLRGVDMTLRFPSVGATENLMMAATLARGTTVLRNAAREPEIVDLACALRSMGADIEGEGSDVIVIRGGTSLGGMTHRVLPDRIEAGTLLIAAAATCGGNVFVRDARRDDLGVVLDVLAAAGVELSCEPGGIRARRSGNLVPIDVATAPFPGFPTDLQAQLMALLCFADGESTISETIFENRFMHVQELVRLGADIRVDGGRAFVRGPARLEGAEVMATDLRASVCLIVAGLAAENTTRLQRVYHLDRGYERIEAKLAGLGALIERRSGSLTARAAAASAEYGAGARQAALAAPERDLATPPCFGDDVTSLEAGGPAVDRVAAAVGGPARLQSRRLHVVTGGAPTGARPTRRRTRAQP